MSAIKAAGYEPGKDVKIGMDCASSEFFKNGIYDYSIFEGENGKKRTADEQIAYLEDLINNYPIDSIEDGMSEKRLGRLEEVDRTHRQPLPAGWRRPVRD